MKNNEESLYQHVAQIVSEALRKEAEWSQRAIVPEAWGERDEKFRSQFVNVMEKYIKDEKLPTPKESHDIWMKSYLEMGWRYGRTRDPEKKLHPDLVPYYELPKDERDKDAIFLASVFLVKEILKYFNKGVNNE